MNICLFSTAYLAPVEYYGHLAICENPIIEAHENYIKQTYRNRCVIANANNIQNLIVPVHKFSNHTLISDIKIDNSPDWQKNHWRSILSAYGSAPFFIYYDYILEPFFQKKYTFLLDLNLELQEEILKLLKFDTKPRLTESFIHNPDAVPDFRSSISPKKKTELNFPSYYQVFSDRHGFLPNLSIIDLIFNIGPEARDYLLKLKN
jgi:hypothetical protein